MEGEKLKRCVAKISCNGGWGTGIAISPELVATAGHVIKGLDISDIEIQFLSVQAGADTATTTKFKVSAIAYRAPSPIDFVVLRLSKPWLHSGLEGSELGTACFLEGQKWSGRGYPCLGKTTPYAKLTSVGGDAYLHVASDKTFDLGTRDAPQDIQDWQGLSGGPVVFENKLVGIIYSVPQKLPKRLSAVSIPYLLKYHEGFKQLYDNEFISDKEIKTAFEEAEKALSRESVDDLKHLLLSPFGKQLKRFLVDALSTYEIKQEVASFSEEEVAERFISQYGCAWLLTNLQQGLAKISEELKTDEQKFQYCTLLNSVTDLGCKLISKSMSIEVLNNHRLYVGRYQGKEVILKLPVAMAAYADAVVSKWVGKQANLMQSEIAFPVVQQKYNAASLDFDHSSSANEESVLIGVHKCITGKDHCQYKNETDKWAAMRDDILIEVESATEDEQGEFNPKKLQYFIVEDTEQVRKISNAQGLQDFIAQELDGKLKFFDITGNHQHKLTKNEKKLFYQLQKIFELKKIKES